MTPRQHPLRLVALLVLAATTTLTAYAQSPVPDPTGAYAIGRLSVDLVDNAREEVFTEAPADKRRLLVDVYYPAIVNPAAPRGSYASPALANVFDYNEEQRAWTAPVYDEAPAADGEFPLLVFSPALGQISLYYSSLIHEVASHGYVIAVLWHPYSTSLVVFPDGTVVRSSEAGRVAGDTLEAQMAGLERLGAVWVADQQFVLDTLTQSNSVPAVLRNHVDVDRIGAFGHSFGGAVAVQLAHDDERLKAALDMDGTMFGTAASEGSRVPFLFLEGDPPPPTDEQLQEIGISREQFDAEEQEMLDTFNRTLAAGVDSRSIKFEKARHNAFWTDQLFYSKDWEPGLLQERLGDIDPDATFLRIHTTIREFFDKHLLPEQGP